MSSALICRSLIDRTVDARFCVALIQSEDKDTSNLTYVMTVCWILFHLAVPQIKSFNLFLLENVTFLF